MPGASVIAADLKCMGCARRLIINGKLKCLRCATEVLATLGKEVILCSNCSSPRIILAKKDKAFCPKKDCKAKTSMKAEEVEKMTTTATLDKTRVFRDFVLMATQSSNPHIRARAASIIQELDNWQIGQRDPMLPLDIGRIETIVGVPIRFNEGFPYCKPEEASFSMLWKGRCENAMNQIVELKIHPFYLAGGKCIARINLEVRNPVYSGSTIFRFNNELVSIRCYEHGYVEFLFDANRRRRLDIHNCGITLHHESFELDLSPPMLMPVQ